MKNRLELARRLLSNDGTIWITLDDVENHYLKVLCDDIFTRDCFVTEVEWQHSDNSNNNALTFSEDVNHILVYSKKPNWKPKFLNDPEKRKHFKNPDNDPKGPWFDGNPVNNPGLRPNLQFDIIAPNGNVIKHPANGWRWSKETMDEKFATGELRFSDDCTRVIRRTYLCDMEGLPPSNHWTNFDITEDWFVYTDNYGTSEEKAFVAYFRGYVAQLRKTYNRIYLIRNEREFHIYSFEDGERFEPDYVLFLQRDKTDGYEQLQIFIEPKGTQLLEKDAWKERFLLQLKTEAVPATIFVDDNDYKIWGLHFFNQENRMKEFDSEFAALIGK